MNLTINTGIKIMSRSDLASERKIQIINATIECITRYGYSNFSMQDVAKVADVSKGIIHYYFLNKEDLMMTVLDHVSSDIEKLLQSTEINSDPVTRLSNAVWMCASVVQNKREYYRINMDFWTLIDQKEKVRQEVASHYAKFRNSIAMIIQHGINLGVFRNGDANQYASMIIAMIDGIALQWLFDESVFQNYDDIIKFSEEAMLNFLVVKT
ncbi:MAG: TetR/AcrR family transcriptional regulator [Spirobacillus cienkowskii]|jgi:TetR/AcrR family fatty acid metabolism transcriptional regulator|uniref:TetR/AcrR family transcriptional regulator n=2 Tax=Spirobacillus cienkowskii TaxID=495820 RepID=A0A369KT06_9BACT|nr:MAG: TetR/AcrR family transcriptional regulator [Spirobacillus cienkowskii]